MIHTAAILITWEIITTGTMSWTHTADMIPILPILTVPTVIEIIIIVICKPVKKTLIIWMISWTCSMVMTTFTMIPTCDESKTLIIWMISWTCSMVMTTFT